MKGKVTLLSAGIFLVSVFWSAGLKAQQAVPMVVDNVIKVNLRKPPQPSKYYSGTNIRKDKKFKAKVVMMKGYDCPSYLHFDSKPQRQREKMLYKQRKKINR